MVRSAIADDSFLNYLNSFAKLDCPTVGLILGQPTESKDYIIHFTRTPPYTGDGENSSKKIVDLPDTWIADHARHVTRMLPGGMYVLGIFIVSQEDIFGCCTPKIKTILAQIHKKLKTNEYLYGLPKDSDKLILNYSSSTHSYVFKNYNYDTGFIGPCEITFQNNLALKWLQVECKYELDQVFPITLDQIHWPLKLHITEILNSINANLKSGIFFFDGEVKDQDESLESIGKKRKGPRLKSAHVENSDIKLMQVTIILPMGDNLTSEVVVINCGGQIRLAGHVTSKVWLHPKATVKDASDAIIQDITRSLAARLEMHWDSLIEEEHDTNSIHETPRRVMVNLPTSKVTLSDYLFPGEGSQEAQISLSELLDIKISEPNIIFDVEGQADLSTLCNEGIDTDNDDALEKLPNTTNKKIFIAGLGIAFIVLVISLLIHFIKNLE